MKPITLAFIIAFLSVNALNSMLNYRDIRKLKQQIEGIEKAHKQASAAITDATPIRIGGGVAVITPYNPYYEHTTNWPAVITNFTAIGCLSGASVTNTTNVQLYRFDSKEGK